MKNTSILLFLMFAVCVAKAQIVSTESFDATTFVPAGWSLNPALTQNAWVRTTNGTTPTVTPHSGAAMARFRSSSQQITTGTQQILVSRTVDYSSRGTAAANVSFWMYRDNTSITYDTIRVFVGSSDTIDASSVYLGTIARNRTYAMPDTQSTNGWYLYTFSIPTSFTNNTTTRFLWQGTNESTPNASANMFIDDVSFDEFPNACNGTPNVGNTVFQFPILCGGGGSTAVSLTAPITGVTGLTYAWEQSNAVNGPWTSFGTNSPTATTGNLTLTTYIRCVVSCATSSLSYTTPTDSIVVTSNPIPTVTISPSPAIFCAGSTGVTLSATGAGSYSWSPVAGLSTNTGNTVVASPTSNTTYMVLGTDSLGCSDTAMVNVGLANPPTVAISATPNDSICSGGTIILNSVQGNTQGLTYLWSDGKTTRRDTLVVNNTMTMSVTVTNNAGCSSTDSITLYALPAQISGFKYTVIGNTYSFTDTTINGSNWIWDFGDGNGSTMQNPTYTYSSPGNYTVVLIVTGNCKTDTISIPIAVYPLGTSDLTETTGIKLYPNPVSSETILESIAQVQSITVFNMLGEQVKEIIPTGSNQPIRIFMADLPSGLYEFQILTIEGMRSIRCAKQ